MIAIQNVSKRPRKTGLHTYEICVTKEIEPGRWARQPLTTFKHRREEGMAACLENAAKAIRAADAEKMILLLEAGRKEPKT